MEEKIAGIRDAEPDALLLVTGDLTAYASDEQFELATSYLSNRAAFSHGRTIALRFGREAAKIIPGNHDHWSGRAAQHPFDLVMYGGPTAMFGATFSAMPTQHLEQPIGGGRKLVIAGIDTDAGLKDFSPAKFLGFRCENL